MPGVIIPLDRSDERGYGVLMLTYIEWLDQMEKDIEAEYPLDDSGYKKGFLQAIAICRSAYLIRQGVEPIHTKVYE